MIPRPQPRAPVSRDSLPGRLRHRMDRTAAERRGIGPQRQPQGEGRSGAFLAPDRDLAAVRGGDVLDDGQPEPGPASRPRPGRVDPVEPLEDPLQIPLGYADALVRDADLDRIVA